VRERGIPGWAAVLLLLLIAGVGGVIDQISGASIQGAFNWALILASLVAILLVRRRQMFPVVIAPPLVYFIASAAKLYFSSNGLKDRAALTDAAANWLVYGFPAIAGATAIVLVIAGVRMIGRR
jgi:Gpi18-like mannosyltransferase